MDKRRFVGLVAVVGGLLVLGGLVTVARVTIHGCGGGMKGREAALRTDLRTFRDVIAQFHSDRGEYPRSLQELVEEDYLRAIPVDPVTKSAATWVPTWAPAGPGRRMIDVRSGSTARGSDGRRYSEW